ncbi:uncharacterized protein BDV17DRAFT_232174 [Aspergillus undulatus]|uniref:uncharacterized protein n=1 Tax=Aspergillus undulatus TaxID=1810928 RepID=UPI003CCE4096
MSTILLVGVFLFADEKIPLSAPLKRALYFTSITSSVIASALYPPDSATIVVYAYSFISVAFALRAVELLVIHRPSQLKRLEKVHDDFSSPPVYIWQSLPSALSFARFLYVCDLLLNPRGIGWAHGSKKYLPPLEKLSAKSTPINGNGSKPSEAVEQSENEKFLLREPVQGRLTFLAIEALKLVIAFVVFDAYRTFFGRNYFQLCTNFHSLLNSAKLQKFELQYLGFELCTSPETSERIVRRFLLPPAAWAASYGFIDGIHAAVAIFSVGFLYYISPTLAGDPWMYPAVFGSWRYIFWPRLKGVFFLPFESSHADKTKVLTDKIDIWGKLWHDLCRRALVSSSTALIPKRTPLPVRRALVGVLSFVISGVVHAAGTYAVSKDAHAVLMMMVFFIVLPVFIAAQEAVTTALERILPDWSIIRELIWLLNVAYVIWWGYHTAPWFFDYSMIPESLASIPVPEHWSFWHTA